ncbi:GNAT family N-acetyltransferase [Myxococcus sp. K15C18031901]|uniref:GNAT family N-acetyltransferase n=1 Tax=Myxococcus dinghuensis TaxID=2906761 RepID=UPI0020A78E45|nr:GNAT family N-acetyltransferase [Myxococcus dinghuensis]MCP3104714.1 GNAT family N-acetyltransferase [Myxococcus dinghuensis]
MKEEVRQGPWRLRAAGAEDHAAFSRLFRELGVDDPPPDLALWQREVAPRTRMVDGPGGVVGYTSTEVLGTLGYVQQLVVDAAVRRQGVGRWVMGQVAESFRARGCRDWTLNVKRDNTAALALYASLGLRPSRQAVNLGVTRAQVATLPASPERLAVVPALEADWPVLTEAFGLLPGKLARFATLGSHQLLRLSREDGGAGEVLGMMDVRAPAAVLFPFFAVSLGHARVLLEHAFALLGETRASLGVVVTDDAALESRLREAGAGVRLETFELRGPLPAPDLLGSR